MSKPKQQPPAAAPDVFIGPFDERSQDMSLQDVLDQKVINHKCTAFKDTEDGWLALTFDTGYTVHICSVGQGLVIQAPDPGALTRTTA